MEPLAVDALNQVADLKAGLCGATSRLDLMHDCLVSTFHLNFADIASDTRFRMRFDKKGLMDTVPIHHEFQGSICVCKNPRMEHGTNAGSHHH